MLLHRCADLIIKCDRKLFDLLSDSNLDKFIAYTCAVNCSYVLSDLLSFQCPNSDLLLSWTPID